MRMKEEIKVPKVCLFCDEELRFEKGRGWVHKDGKLYKTRLEYPRLCRNCLAVLPPNGFCNICEIQHQIAEVDDHIAHPVPA